MTSPQLIDFTRGDFGGVWLLFVLFPLLVLTTLRKRHVIGIGWLSASRRIGTRLLVGLVLAMPIVVLVMILQRLPPRQHFVNLRLEKDHVVLGYRWPEPELSIPINQITSVATVRARRRRLGPVRLTINTTNEHLASFSFSRLKDGELMVLDELKTKVAENRLPEDPEKGTRKWE